MEEEECKEVEDVECLIETNEPHFEFSTKPAGDTTYVTHVFALLFEWCHL